MTKVKVLNRWGIYQNNDKEVAEYGFEFTVIHPDNMDCSYALSPADTDMECATLEAAVSWIKLY